MIKWLLNKLFPLLTPREKELMLAIQNNEANGVRIVISERGGWRVEFDSPEAMRWYYKKSFAKFRGINIKGEEE